MLDNVHHVGDHRLVSSWVLFAHVHLHLSSFVSRQLDRRDVRHSCVPLFLSSRKVIQLLKFLSSCQLEFLETHWVQIQQLLKEALHRHSVHQSSLLDDVGVGTGET